MAKLLKKGKDIYFGISIKLSSNSNLYIFGGQILGFDEKQSLIVHKIICLYFCKKYDWSASLLLQGMKGFTRHK